MGKLKGTGWEPAKHHMPQQESFLAQLSWQELQILRAAVRRTFFKYYPTELCTDAEADRIIESQVPVTAQNMIKKMIDRKLA